MEARDFGILRVWRVEFGVLVRGGVCATYRFDDDDGRCVFRGSVGIVCGVVGTIGRN